jgi:hypothetical protein
MKTGIHYGVLVNSNSKEYILEKGVFTDIGFYQFVNEYFESQKTNYNNRYFIRNKLDSLYVFSNQINPNYFKADFNGDNIEDIAFLIRNINNDKIGLIFFHSETEYYIVGAGNKDSALEQILYDTFEISIQSSANETVIDKKTGDIIGDNVIQLKNISLFMYEEEGTTGLLTWNGKKYIYIHTGD